MVHPPNGQTRNENAMTQTTPQRFDYIIIGAGTAGCVLANRLSKDPQKTVLLLEAGKKDNYFWIDIPVGCCTPLAIHARTGVSRPGRARFERTSIGYARGKVLGGCSSINAMIYMRGQQSDYDHWASLGNRGWGWQDVLPVFRRSEDYQHGADDFHGSGSELRVEERRVNWEILDVWRDAAAQCGIPKIDEFNRGDNFGNAYFQMNQRQGKRWSAVRAFLDPIKERTNLTILTEASVRELIFDKDSPEITATGVKVIHGGHEHVFQANAEVILPLARASYSYCGYPVLDLPKRCKTTALRRGWNYLGSAKTCRIIYRFARSTK